VIRQFDFKSEHQYKLVAQTVSSLHLLRMPGFLMRLKDSKKGENNGKPSETIMKAAVEFIHVEEVPTVAYKVTMGGLKIASKDSMGKSDPYFLIEGIPHPKVSFPFNENPIQELENKEPKHRVAPIYVSEVRNNEENPDWGTLTLYIDEVGDICKPITIKVFDFDKKNCGSQYIGKIETSLMELIQPRSLSFFKLRNQEDKKKYRILIRERCGSSSRAKFGSLFVSCR